VTKPEIMADGRVAHVALPIKFYVDTWTLSFEPRRGALVTASYAANQAARVAQAASRDSHGSLAHEPTGVSLIPVKTPTPARAAPTQSDSAPAAQSTTSGETAMPMHVANVSVEQMGVVRMQRSAAEPAAAAPVVPAASPVFERRPDNARPASGETGEWTLLEIALAGLAGALVLLFAGYFRRQLKLWRGFRAD
jgi:hypothetical protein